VTATEAGQRTTGGVRKPKALEPDEMAEILAYAQLQGLKSAGERYGISERTIGRWRKDLKEGRRPELSKLVDLQRAEAATLRKDRIGETLDLMLVELQSRRTSMTPSELIDAVEKVGELRVTRDVFSPDGQSTTKDQQDPRPDTGAGPAASGTIRPTGSRGSPEPVEPPARVH
jgi:hypothetical protein